MDELHLHASRTLPTMTETHALPSSSSVSKVCRLVHRLEPDSASIMLQSLAPTMLQMMQRKQCMGEQVLSIHPHCFLKVSMTNSWQLQGSGLGICNFAQKMQDYVLCCMQCIVVVLLGAAKLVRIYARCSFDKIQDIKQPLVHTNACLALRALLPRTACCTTTSSSPAVAPKDNSIVCQNVPAIARYGFT